jgi:adenine deaminase
MEKIDFYLRGNLVDVVKRRIFKAELHIVGTKIESIVPVNDCPDVYILPGIVDSHVHIESSMLIPQQFARLAVKHGTVATVSDPHEIANVMGVEGVNFMIEDSRKVTFKFHFGVPSCVPATSFETAGFVLDSNQVDELLGRNDLVYLSEMMNFPGVVYGDEEVARKIKSAQLHNKPVDGHAPGLSGESLKKYAEAGITTDHESTTVDEAVEKIKLGIKLLIREGSAAKNFDALIPVLKTFPNEVMFCTDDCHPDDLVEKHILDLIKRGLKNGYNLFDLLSAATFNPIKHYNLNVGILQTGDPADFFIVDNLEHLNVLETYINGNLVYDGVKSLIEGVSVVPINNFNCTPISKSDISIADRGNKAKVMLAFDGDLYTGMELVLPKVFENFIISDIENDVLKIVVVNRYKPCKPVVGLIKNFGLKTGAIAGSIAHDSHNIIAVGVSDDDIVNAINKVIEMQGGIVAENGDEVHSLALPVAGLMTNEAGEIVAEKYKLINQKPKEWGSKLHAPFMTLSFMALLVIPKLKIGDKGMFDGEKFELTDLFV